MHKVEVAYFDAVKLSLNKAQPQSQTGRHVKPACDVISALHAYSPTHKPT
jgi:hypothetical protein